MEKLDKLRIDLKAVSDALVQVNRTLGEVAQECSQLKKAAESIDVLKREAQEAKDRLAKITSFISGAP